MSNDPHTISPSRVLTLLRELGLDPVDGSTIKQVTIDPYCIEVVRYRLNENGQKYSVGRESATETTLIKMGRE